MPDIAAIGSVLSSLKTATEIAKFLRDTDVSLERAELKMKLADLTGALADAKIEMSSIQDALLDREARIKDLEASFARKDTVVRKYDAYYSQSPTGNPTGRGNVSTLLGC